MAKTSNFNHKSTVRPSKKWTLITCTTLVLFAAAFALLHYQGRDKQLPASSNTPVINSKTQGSNSSYSTEPLNPTVNSTTEDKKTGQSAPANTAPSNPGKASVTITRINSSDPVTVGTLISGMTSGSCTLTATQTGRSPYVAHADITLNVNSYSCSDFNIPNGVLSQGSWSVVVSATDRTQTVSSNTWNIP